MNRGPQGQSLLEYLDAELAGFADFDSVVTAGGSTFAQTALAAFPERPGALNQGYRVTTTQSNAAYGQVDNVGSLSPGDAVYLGFWLRITDLTTSTCNANRLAVWSGGVWNTKLMVYVYGDGRLRLRYQSDATYNYGTLSADNVADLNAWTYVVLAMRRATTNVASDGWARLYMNGARIDNFTGVDNYDTLSGTLALHAGIFENIQPSFSMDLDEIMVASAYPEPYVPPATSDYVEAARTVVCYRHASADSRTFARYCSSALGVPRANLCPLPAASSTESLATYATFQAQVETDLAAWLALNASAAAQCCCIVPGYGVPQFFTSGGVLHSAASRLMKLGTAFSSRTVNPFHGRQTRITSAELVAAGVYLTATMDAPSLADAEAYVTKGLAVGAAAEGEKVLASDSAVRASLAAQATRLARAATYTPGDLGALMLGSMAAMMGPDPYWPTAGTRAAILCTTEANLTLRGVGSYLMFGLQTLGWAAGVGYSIANGGVEADAESLVEMLRGGGSFAEAALAAVHYLNYAAIPIGLPTMTLGFPQAGYNLYGGVADRTAVDWGTPIAYGRAGANSIAIAQADDTDLWYGLTAVSSAGVESTVKRTFRAVVAGGVLVGPPPNALTWATARAAAGGKVEVAFQYNSAAAAGVATAVQVARCTGAGGVGADWDNPVKTVTVVGDAAWKGELSVTFDDGETVHLALRAVTATGVAGPAMVPAGSPVAADSSGPEAAGYLVATQAD